MATDRPPASLWSHPPFVRLWLGQTISKFGSHITWAALSVTAVITLRATPTQVGILEAFGGLAFLLVGLFAGVWVDRLRRRPILIATDLGRALVLALIPLAAWQGWLRLELLYLVAALVSVQTVFFNLADRAFLPALVPVEQLVEANGKLGVSDSAAEITGPGLAGTLVQWLTAPFAIVIDVLSYLVSALCIAGIRVQEAAPAPVEMRQNVWQEIGEGLRVVLRNPTLRALAAAQASFSLFGSFIGTLYWLYLVRELHLTPTMVGLSVGAGGIGALIGAAVAHRVQRRFGVARTLLGCLLLMSLGGFVLPSLRGPMSVVFPALLAVQLLGDIPIAIFFIQDISLRQKTIPHALIGRASAGMDFLTHGLTPLGALLAGLLGDQIGIRPTLFLSVFGPLLALLFIAASPLRHARD